MREVRRNFRLRWRSARTPGPEHKTWNRPAGCLLKLDLWLLHFLLVFGDFFNLSGIFTAGRRAAQRTIAPSTRSVSPPPIAAALGLSMLAALVPAAMAALPRAGRPIAVVGISAGHAAIIGAIGEAGGSVLSVSGSKSVIAMPGDASFVSRLHSLGYWVTLDAKAFTGCAALLSISSLDAPEIIGTGSINAGFITSSISTQRGLHANQHA